jgi:hypothetical protein
MTIWSCVTFFNEFDLIDLRIAEELDVVDKLVIAEADRTFQGDEKPLHLAGNPKYEHPKIELVAITEGFVKDPWANEAHQRNSLLLTPDYDDDDVFLVADADEITRRKDLPRIIEMTRVHGLVRPVQKHYCYKINLQVPGFARSAAFAVTGRYLRESGKQFDDFRRKARTGKFIRASTKHFTYMADAEGIAYKLKSFAHSELNRPEFTDLDVIERKMADQQPRLRRVEIDDSYPETIRQNLDYWQKHIY